MPPLSKKIILTLMYYDIFDYPMTAFEIWKYLLSDNPECFSKKDDSKEVLGKGYLKISDILEALGNEKLSGLIFEKKGFYFLRGREIIVEERLKRNKIAEEKYKIAKKAVFWLRFIPFVRMVLVTGRLAMKNTEKESDVDLLVVIRKNHIFTGRILVTGLVHLLGIRRHGENISDRVCLNYFVTDQSLEIGDKNIFSSSEYYFSQPIFGGEVFKKFRAVNSWIESFKENYFSDELEGLKITSDGFFSQRTRTLGEIILSFDFLEKWLGVWQRKRIFRDPRTKFTGSFVSADENALVFLPDPHGPKVEYIFRKRASIL